MTSHPPPKLGVGYLNGKYRLYVWYKEKLGSMLSGVTTHFTPKTGFVFYTEIMDRTFGTGKTRTMIHVARDVIMDLIASFVGCGISYSRI